MIKKNFYWIALFSFTLLLFWIVRERYHTASIERDVGTYAYGAQEILRGKLPYLDFFDHKPPLIYIIFAAMLKLFGDSTYYINVSATIAVLLSSIFVFLISRKIFSIGFSYLAWGYFLLSMSLPFIQGGQSNTEVFMIFFVIASIWLVLSSEKAIVVFFSGFLMGLGVLTKTVALANVLALVLWFILRKPKKLSALYYFFVGVTVPLGITFYIFAKKNALYDFWFANIIYNQAYISQIGLLKRLLLFPPEIILENLPLWVFGIGGIILFLKQYFSKIKDEIGLIIINSFVSLIAIQYLGRASPHYYIQVIPFLTISGFFLAEKMWFRYKKGALFPILLVSSLLFPILFCYKFVVLTDPSRLNSRIFNRYLGKWLDESKLLSEYISNRVPEDAYIYNLGRETQIYFYTKTRSSSRYIYDRPFYLFEKTINEACLDLSKNRPKIVINTLKKPYFSEEIASVLWDKLSSCGNLEIEKKEEVYFAEIWFIK